MPRLEKWSLKQSSDGKGYLKGFIYNDEKNRFPDGLSVHTSAVISALDDDHVMTRNTAYELGGADEEYEKLFPDAKKRLIKNLRVQGWAALFRRINQDLVDKGEEEQVVPFTDIEFYTEQLRNLDCKEPEEIAQAMAKL